MKNIVIIGADKGIGLALRELLLTTTNDHIIATSRDYSNSWRQSDRLSQLCCDITSEDSITQCAQTLSYNMDRIDWLINCAGILHNEHYLPEKSLAQLNAHQMLDNFSTNAMGHLLINKNLEKLIAAASQPVVCSISARIGSIGDNHLGGWYAYRMSKAALNMGYKTLSIEWKRKFPHIKLLLIHPGTTDTKLSKPFQKRMKKGMLQSSEFTAQAIHKQIALTASGGQNSLYVDFKGKEIEW